MNPTPSLSSMDRAFDQSAATELLNRLEQLAPYDPTDPLGRPDTIAVRLRVRAPDNLYEKVLDECLGVVNRLAESCAPSVENPEAFVDCVDYIDKDSGSVHLRATANLARALVQEQDYFWAVELDESRWG